MRIVHFVEWAYCLAMEWTARRLQDGLDAACELSGHDIINAEGAHRLSAG
jgi:hypothetical protein